MVHLEGIEFALDWVVLVLSIAVFFIFIWHLRKFVPGEAKKVFALLTLFLGVNFITFLFVDGWEIFHFIAAGEGEAAETFEDYVEVTAHILQVIGLGILLYIAVIFAKFADKLEKEGNGK